MSAKTRFLWLVLGLIMSTVLAIVNVWLIIIDAQWHINQMMQQGLLLITYDSSHGPGWMLFLVLDYWDEFEHAILGQSMSSSMLWFLCYLGVTVILNNLVAYLDGKLNWERKVLFGCISFIIFASLITPYIIVYVMKNDTAFHLGSLMLQANAVQLVAPELQFIVHQYIIMLAIGRWDLFEHAQGQSASSYVIYFFISLVIYIIITLCVGYYIKHKNYYEREIKNNNRKI